MIDVNSERVISLADAAKLLPKRRAGKKPHVATLYRWVADGVKGIKLESIMVGSTRCTSREALQRFFDALTALADSQTPPPPPKPKDRRRAIKAAEKRLARSGL
jgi:hypothetical protein